MYANILIMEINFWAVLASGIANMVVGGLWYSPIAFGKLWMKLSGFDAAKEKEIKEKGASMSYFVAFIGSLILAYVFAHVLNAFNSTTVQMGMQGAFWMWLGFVATTQLSSVLWEGKSVKLFILNTAQSLVALVVMGIILSLWK